MATDISSRQSALLILVVDLALLSTFVFVSRKLLMGAWPNLELYLSRLAVTTICYYGLLACTLSLPILEKSPPILRISPATFGVHLLCLCTIACSFSLICKASLSSACPELVWIPLFVLALGTLLASLVRISSLASWISTRSPALFWAVPLSVTTLFVRHLANWLWATQLSATFISSTFHATRWLLGSIYNDVWSDPSQWALGTPRLQVQIASECAGYHGLSLVTLIAGVYLWTRRHQLRFPRAIWLLPLGWGLSLGGNCVRIAAIVVMGTNVSTDIALHALHPEAGWLWAAVIGWTLILLGESLECLRGVPNVPPQPGSSEAPMSTIEPLIFPLGALLFTFIVSMALSVHYDYLYPFRVIVVGAVLWSQRRAYVGLFQTPTWRPVALGVAAYIIWISLASNHGEVSPWVAMSSGRALWWTLARVLGSILVIPLTEELAFRGYLLRALQARDFGSVPIGKLTPFAVVVSSLAFGSLHEQRLASFLAGLAYAWATHRRGSLGDAVVAHAVTNACLAVEVLAFGHWWLWN